VLATGIALHGFSASADDIAGIVDSAVGIVIDEPKRGEPVRNSVHQAPIRGNAFTEGKRRLAIDVMIAIDISGSTRAASGTDVDGDGEIGFNPRAEQVPSGLYPPDMLSTDPHDTILAAEITAAAALLQNLDPNQLRVGVLSFGGEVNLATGRQVAYGQQDAWIEVPLTSDFGQVRRALQSILARGPRGGTNFAAGIRLAVTESFGGDRVDRPARREKRSEAGSREDSDVSHRRCALVSLWVVSGVGSGRYRGRAWRGSRCAQGRYHHQYLLARDDRSRQSGRGHRDVSPDARNLYARQEPR